MNVNGKKIHFETLGWGDGGTKENSGRNEFKCDIFDIL
jgi:hypothetical protein